MAILGTTMELTTGRYTATIMKENGDPVKATELTALTLTLTDLETGAVINSRNSQDVLNKNGVAIDESGNLAWTLASADNTIISDTSGPYEIHRAVFCATWGTKKLYHKIDLKVMNLSSSQWR